MNRVRPRLVHTLLALLVIFGPFAIPVVIIAYLFGLFSPCIVETRQRITGVSGLNFEIKEFDCDTLAKEGWISVYAYRPGQSEKVLVFEYVAGGVGPLPRITAVNPQTVRISIPAISSTHLRQHAWDGVTIEYDIGQIDYPHPERDK